MSRNLFRNTLRAGFTLIEVLVTVVILSVGIVLVLRSFEVALYALGQAKESIMANDIIASRITEIRLANVQDDGPDVGSFNGMFTDRRKGFFGNCAITARMRSFDGSNTLHEIRIEVWREALSRQYSAGTYLCVAN
ncbi:MAG: prepilin-type N-terminal cleavage/methylation domain-containing protein [Lentisphaerae bacterium]|nr:prepilin-type N-terminal cleavage/methylation domain-containing protein [Lentisphaerota bacterium]